jgi:hypothetical protein
MQPHKESAMKRVTLQLEFVLVDNVAWTKQKALQINNEICQLLEDRMRIAAYASTGINRDIVIEQI